MSDIRVSRSRSIIRTCETTLELVAVRAIENEWAVLQNWQAKHRSTCERRCLAESGIEHGFLPSYPALCTRASALERTHSRCQDTGEVEGESSGGFTRSSMWFRWCDWMGEEEKLKEEETGEDQQESKLHVAQTRLD
jgi:hypothetical protein